MAKKRVAILGGGVAGMSAAHELITRGFDVEVFESKKIAGGKARSYPYPNTGTQGREDLPAEHGFRFFPGFYRHLPETMDEIPVGGGKCVLDNLVGTEKTLIARVGQPEIFAPAHFPVHWEDVSTAFDFLFSSDFGIPTHEVIFFIDRLLVLLTSCDGRRLGQWEKMSWWDFVDARNKSENFQKYLATGLTRSLVACKAHKISARTGGYILLQLMFDFATPGQQVDRVLNGPTNTVWIDPWRKLLERRGVTFHTSAPVTDIHCVRRRITGVTVLENQTSRRVTADYYIAALPKEVMEQLLTPELIAAEPRLAELRRLETNWMNGIMFYLDRDVPVVEGHSLYIDSPWALTAISQQQFWHDYDVENYGDGRVEGILSVDISDWDTPGILFGKTAKQCTRDEVKEEVWAQLKAHLNDDGVHELEDANLLDWFLDEDITFPNPTATANLEPLLINTVRSWEWRPDAVTSVSNLFLASDYVRTFTDLATMEGACEAARRAVNGILEASGSNRGKCEIYPLDEPFFFEPFKAVDRIRWKLGLPNTGLSVG
jgi:uncharacterized protein with NAD-binding domain and iron-sulfur cluster